MPLRKFLRVVMFPHPFHGGKLETSYLPIVFVCRSTNLAGMRSLATKNGDGGFALN
jgi:hypothetical protein